MAPVFSAPAHAPRPRALRRAGAGLVLCLLASASVACGGGGPQVPEEASEGLQAVDVSGEPGSSPEVEWADEMAASELEIEVLVQGDGVELAQGDQAFVHLYVGNGFTQEEVLNTYDGAQPEVLTVSEELTPAIADAMEGRSVGSRVAAAAPPEDAFGDQGNPQLGIGNQDSVLFIVDILGQVRAEVDGEQVEEPGGPVPRLVTQEGTITRLDFPPALKGTGTLQKRVLVEGDGEPVGKESFIAVRYLGQVLGTSRPFDESYSAAEPTVVNINGVVQGWTRGLQGVPAGSRVVLVIPPKLGYGEQGQPDAGITGEDTMVFVIDVLGVS